MFCTLTTRTRRNKHILKLARVIILLALPVFALGLTAAAASLRPSFLSFPPFSSSSPATPTTARFAVLGDFGFAGQNELDVANLIKSWNPDFITTTGDNNYPDGCASTIDANIGQYYHDFIFPYTGTYGPGATSNKFFPTMGNHDWASCGSQPYLNYFALPAGQGNERYYDYSWGPVHFFVLNANNQEPDGNTVTSTQALWLQSRLAAATEPWKLVYMHHPPYSSGTSNGSTPALQWPYAQWGASAVLAGHEHQYERLDVGGTPYFVTGLGGETIYDIGPALPQSVVRYNYDFGAMRVNATSDTIRFEFITRSGSVIDTLTLNTPTPTLTVTGTPPTSTPTNVPTSTYTPTQTPTPTNTPTTTSSPTVTSTITATPIPTNTVTGTPPTSTPTFTVTPTPTDTPTYTATSTNTPSGTVTQTGTPTLTPTVLPGLCWEAESGLIQSPFAIVTGTTATYISQTVDTLDASQGGRASYRFLITQPGSYVVSGTINGPSFLSSFYIKIDGEPIPGNTWDAPDTHGQFQGLFATWRPNPNPVAFNLGAGEHELIIRGRENNLLLDKLCVEPSSQSTATPTNTPGNTPTATSTPCNPSQPLFEGFESGTLGAFSSAVPTCAPGGCGWIAATSPHSGTYSAFAPDGAGVSDQQLVSTNAIAIPPDAAGASLSFWHKYDFEYGSQSYDGGVVEVSTDNGASWLTPTFTRGGYNGTLSTCCSNPLSGRAAFVGNSGGQFVNARLDLMPYAGRSINVRFREGTDSVGGAGGWYIDDITLDLAGPCFTCAVVISDSISSTDATQNGRLLRGGNASTCGTPESCSTVAGTYHYKLYQFTNTSNWMVCVTATVLASCAGNNSIFSGAYLNSFDPNNVCTNIMGDPGFIDNGVPVSYSFNVPANTTFFINVNEVDPGAGCSAYTLTVTGLPNTACATATSTVTSTNTPTITPTSVPRLVGHVVWQGRPAQPNALQQLPITLTLRSAASQVDYPVQNTDASGFFTVSVQGLPSGTYNWRVKSAQVGATPAQYNPGFLATSGVLTLAGLSVTSVDMGLLLDGDCNNDNRVSASDFVILAQAFGSSPGQPNYDNRADINGDGVVSVADFIEIKRNFGLQGALPLGP
jgi:tartrate-resistant acid phosphatase type 5